MSSAQEKPGVIFQRYEKSDGLSSNRIGNIAQDADGFIWIATGNSLQRFDGHYFRTYTTANEPALLSNAVNACISTLKIAFGYITISKA